MTRFHWAIVGMGFYALALAKSPAAGAATPGFFDGVDEASKPVMEEARQRIEKVRKGDITVTLTDQDGKPISGTAHARLISHVFTFGMHLSGYVNSDPPTPLGGKVQEVADELFNTVVVTGYWKAVEPQAGQFNWKGPDALLNWAQKHHKNVRFHCIIYSLPKWVKTLDTEQAWWDAFEQRIKSVADRYGKTIKEFDVINEMVSEKVAWPDKKAEIESYQNFPYLWDPKNGAKALTIARKYLPEAKLVALETGISTPTNAHFLATVDYAKALVKLDAPFDYCGHQGHFFINNKMPLREGHPEAGPGAFIMKDLSAGLDLLAKVGKPVVITEFNPPSRDGPAGAKMPNAGLTPEELAAWTVNYTTLVFSKPYICGLSRWFVVDEGRGVDAGLLTAQGEKKPVYSALRKLLKETWNTDWTGPIDNGRASFHGFYGTYEITVQGYGPVQITCASAEECSAKVSLRRAP